MKPVAEASVPAGDLIEDAAKQLQGVGIESPRQEARLLLAHVMDVEPHRFAGWPETPCGREAVDRFDALLRRRMDREPVSHLVGLREFWSRAYTVNRDVLDPRPDSETLIEAALGLFPDTDAPLRVLDLGTGSGCLLLTILAERRRATGLGVDISPAALEVARGNAARLGVADRVEFAEGDWFGGCSGRFDLILCNPPYIPAGDIAGLAPEVSRHEPALALSGGEDGLDAYRAVLPGLSRHLEPDGSALFEVGAGQASAVMEIARAAGLSPNAPIADLSGVARCLHIEIIG